MARSPWRWFTLALVAAACGGDDGGFTVIGSDGGGGGGTDAGCSTSSCNPLAPRGQQSCPAGQKCTAVVPPAGTILCPGSVVMACVPEGSQALGAMCTWSAAGTGPGRDDCVTGAMCSSDRVCRDICGFGATPADACTAGLVCVRIPGRFEPAGGGQPLYGVCAPPI